MTEPTSAPTEAPKADEDEDEKDDDKAAGGLDTTTLIIIGVGAVVLILIIVLIVVLSSKKKPAAAPVAPVAPVQPVRPVAPVAPVQPVRPAAPPVTPGTTVLGQDAGATTVLGANAGATTVLSQNVNGGFLVRVSNNERVPICTADFTVGRERNSVDYCISGNSNISRVHARFVVRDGKTFIIDNKAANGRGCILVYKNSRGYQATAVFTCYLLGLVGKQIDLHRFAAVGSGVGDRQDALLAHREILNHVTVHHQAL